MNNNISVNNYIQVNTKNDELINKSNHSQNAIFTNNHNTSYITSTSNKTNTSGYDNCDSNLYLEELKKKSKQLKEYYKIKPNIDLNQIVQLSSRLARATNISSVKNVMSSAGRTKAYFNSILPKCESKDRQLAKSAVTQVSRVIVQGRKKISQLSKEQILESRKKAAIREKRIKRARALSQQKKDSIVKRKAAESAHVSCTNSWALTTSYAYKNSLSQGEYRHLGGIQNNAQISGNDYVYNEADASINAYILAGSSTDFDKISQNSGDIESVQSQQILNTGIVIL